MPEHLRITEPTLEAAEQHRRNPRGEKCPDCASDNVELVYANWQLANHRCNNCDIQWISDAEGRRMKLPLQEVE